jgi:hypothetical protein
MFEGLETEERSDIEKRVQRRVNQAVSARLQRLVESARADLARERAALRWLGVGLILITLPYVVFLLLRLA